ncbi:FAD-dependent oxidoreductase [Novosphingobium sp. Gsoil 351]|uniref:FAD-dependent oxidoreductase n=1 Tax=Novosphingobium sp. Gsoil 351 TaxID=2675225 RepID=UPI002101D782|nr:FAD-dependent oxidoreductase [Novosphingobium sp. Gsoil 351]
MTYRACDVAVVGAGAFGAWTALSLAEAGVRVTMIDMYPTPNPRSSSGGESRNIRAAYGADAFYTRWARRAWAIWGERQRQFETTLVYPCGSLRAGSDAEIAAQADLFAALGAAFEVLSPDEVESRWPQVRWSAPATFYEPESGVLAAELSLREVERALRRANGQVIRGRGTLLGQGASTRLEVDGEQFPCGTIVLACGPWLPRLLPDLLGGFIRTPRRELLFVAPELGDPRFGWERCPNLVDPLGWTSADLGNGVKIAPPMRGIDMDPDSAERLPTPLAIDGAKQFLTARLPALAKRPIISAYVSQLENTASEDFIIDRHPEAAHVVIAGGGSGHAFKFGPLLGDYVAQMVLDGSRGEHAARFGLAAHRPLLPGEGA